MISIQVDINEQIAAIRRAQDRLSTDRQELLDQLGVQTLSLAQLAYREKARGGQGSDGLRWDPLARATIEARVRSRAPAKRIVAERKDLARQIENSRGPGSNARRASLRRRREALLRRLQGMVDQEFARHEIGVNTGLQRASAQPGFSGPDGRGGNVLRATQGEFTVGYAREYSAAFDAARKLMPGDLPDDWRAELEAMIERWGERILRDVLGGGGADLR